MRYIYDATSGTYLGMHGTEITVDGVLRPLTDDERAGCETEIVGQVRDAAYVQVAFEGIQHLRDGRHAQEPFDLSEHGRRIDAWYAQVIVAEGTVADARERMPLPASATQLNAKGCLE